MVNQVVFVICIICLVAAIGVAIYFGVEQKKCKDSLGRCNDSQDSIKELQSEMSSDIKTLSKISGDDKTTPDEMNCMIDGISKKQLLSALLISGCNEEVMKDPKGKEICNKYINEISHQASSCDITKPSPDNPRS